MFLAPLLALAACASPEQKAAAAAARGVQALQANDPQAARTALLEAVRQRDDVAEYWLLLARTNMSLKEYGAAHAAYSRALELSRSSLEALQGLGQISLGAGRLDEALQYADQMLLIEPEHAAAALLQGFVHLKKKNYSEARDRADAVLARFPSEEAAIILKASAMFASGSQQEAAALLEQELRISGPTRPKLNALQEFYQQSGSAPGLKRTLHRIVQLEPNSKDAHEQYARFLFSNGFTREGVRFIAPLLRLPHAGELVETLRLAKQTDVAGATLVELARASSPAAAVEIAGVAVDHGYSNDAARILKPLVEPVSKARNPTAIALYGSAQEGMGNTSEATRLAELALEQDPTNPRGVRLRASLALKKGDYDQALADAQLLVRDYPRSLENRQMLAKVYEVKGDTVLAGLVYRQAFNDFPGSSAARSAYATHLRTTGNFSEADRISRTRRSPAVSALVAN